jgi:hypothetical protein
MEQDHQSWKQQQQQVQQSRILRITTSRIWIAWKGLSLSLFAHRKVPMRFATINRPKNGEATDSESARIQRPQTSQRQRPPEDEIG